MGHSNSAQQVRRWIKTAKAAGWRVEPSKDGWKFFHPSGEGFVAVHGSNGSDRRGTANMIGQFRRLGLEVNK